MHDIDRTQTQMGWETDAFEAETAQFEEEDGVYGEDGYEMESPFSEEEEMELAAELLEVSDEEELDQFLGDLFKRAGRAIRKVVKSPIAQKLGGMLKNVASKALPAAGAALGNFVVPGIGGAIGGKLASTAGQMFGLELEGMSGEDQEYEVARRFVRLAGDAAQQAANATPNASPQQAAQQAMIAAAQKHAPGLLSGAGPNGKGSKSSGQATRTGRWIRKGDSIIVLNVHRS